MKTKDILPDHPNKNHLNLDKFAKDCFSFKFPLETEGRTPSQIQGIKDVPDLVKRNCLKEAWNILDAHQDEFYDLDFIYVWQAVILQKNGQTGEAEETLDTGLKKARQKHILCYRMGDLKYKTKDLTSAIKWWVKSIEAMYQTQTVNLWEPFLYLAYIAKGCGDERLFKILIDQVASILVHSELQLEENEQENLNKLLTDLPRETILNILGTLCEKFTPHTVSEFSKTPSTEKNPETSIPRQTKKNRILWFFLLTALIMVFLSGYFIFSKRPDIHPKISTHPGIVQKKNIQNEKEPTIIITKPPPVIFTEKEKLPELKPVEKPIIKQIPLREPVPHKEKYPWMKVKTKTANPDIKKKSTLK